MEEGTKSKSEQGNEVVPLAVYEALEWLERTVSQKDHVARYANNFQFQPSVWDLKVVFGELDQREGKAGINWHTSITVPWLQVRLVSYFLLLQLAWYEQHNGTVKIPASQMPQAPTLPTEEQANDQAAKSWYEIWKKLYTDLLSPGASEQIS